MIPPFAVCALAARPQSGTLLRAQEFRFEILMFSLTLDIRSLDTRRLSWNLIVEFRTFQLYEVLSVHTKQSSSKLLKLLPKLKSSE